MHHFIVHYIMAKSKKNSEFVLIGDIIKSVLKTCRRDSDEELSQVWSLWETAVGDVIANNTKPEAFKGKLLLVLVNSPVWMHQLQFLKKDIINKVNQALGKELVQDIKFKIGPV
jgi:predicted nucleic acid-binding Zn ribbon protein